MICVVPTTIPAMLMQVHDADYHIKQRIHRSAYNYIQIYAHNMMHSPFLSFSANYCRIMIPIFRHR